MGSCSLEAVFLGMRKEVFTTLCFPKLTCVWAALGGACVHNPRQQLTAPHPVTIMHTFTFLFTYFRSERVSGKDLQVPSKSWFSFSQETKVAAPFKA